MARHTLSHLSRAPNADQTKQWRFSPSLHRLIAQQTRDFLDYFMLEKGHILDWLEEWRDDEEKSSNKWHVYNKAYKSLHATSFGGSDDRYAVVRVEELRGVKFIGDKIRKMVESRAMKDNLNSGGAASSSSRSGQKHPGGVLEGASPPKKSRASTKTTAIKRSETTIYSSYATGSENFLPPPHLQRATTAPAPMTDNLDWLSGLGLTKEELELNMLDFDMGLGAGLGAGVMLPDPNMYDYGEAAGPTSPLAPVHNIAQASRARPKAKPKAKAKSVARLSNPVPPPSVFSSADSSLVMDAPSGTGTPNTSTTPATAPVPQIPQMTRLQPHEYDVYLILDCREVRDQKHRDDIYKDLQGRGINIDQKSLNLGDVAFAAKRKIDGELFVLDCILERKRLDDLVKSIQDGRFHEQKVCSLLLYEMSILSYLLVPVISLWSVARHLSRGRIQGRSLQGLLLDSYKYFTLSDYSY